MPYVLTEIQDLRRERVKLGTDVRAIYAKAKKEERAVTTEEDQSINQMLDRATELGAQVEQMERADGLLQELDAPAGRVALVDAAGDAIAAERSRELEGIGDGPRDSETYLDAFRRYLTAGNPYDALRALSEARDQAPTAYRNLQVDDDEQAGYLVPPEQYVNELIKDLDDATFLQQWARSFTVRKAKSLGAPKRTGKASTWVWGSELTTPTPDASLKYGKRNLYPQHATGEIVVSRPFLRSSLLPAEQIIREEISRDGAEHLEQGWLTGSGSGQPLGVYTASADGISTSQDVSTGNSATEIKLTGLREAKYSIKAPYWPRLKWLFSRQGHKQIYSMDDGVGRPLWAESIKVGAPDMVLGISAHISEFNPDTFTTGQYVGILGDWSTYWIAHALDMEIQRLDELYARTNQAGFIARLQVDGMPVLEECWARVKLG